MSNLQLFAPPIRKVKQVNTKQVQQQYFGSISKIVIHIPLSKLPDCLSESHIVQRQKQTKLPSYAQTRPTGTEVISVQLPPVPMCRTQNKTREVVHLTFEELKFFLCYKIYKLSIYEVENIKDKIEIGTHLKLVFLLTSADRATNESTMIYQEALTNLLYFRQIFRCTVNTIGVESCIILTQPNSNNFVKATLGANLILYARS